MSEKTQSEKVSKAESSGNKTLVVGDDAPQKSRLLNNKKLLMPVAIVCLVALAMVIVVYALHTAQEKQKKEVINYAKVRSLVTSGDCSASAQQSISKEQPDPEQVDASIALLNYRALCLEMNGKNQEANKVLEQLKSYYTMKHDTGAISQVNAQITTNNDTVQLTISSKNQQSDIDPAKVKKIDEYFGVPR